MHHRSRFTSDDWSEVPDHIKDAVQHGNINRCGVCGFLTIWTVCHNCDNVIDTMSGMPLEALILSKIVEMKDE
jgi:hypothetical protein